MAERMDEDMPEEPFQRELICSVCRDIFKNPFVLPCSHSFCQECLQGSAKPSGNRCPLCRKRFEEGQAIPNRVLSNVCQAFARCPPPGIQKPDSEPSCNLHMKPLVLYCEKDEQPVCVDCVTLHNTHTLWPLTEAVPICKVNMSQRKDGLFYPAVHHKTIFIMRGYTTAMISFLQRDASVRISQVINLFSVNQKSYYSVEGH